MKLLLYLLAPTKVLAALPTVEINKSNESLSEILAGILGNYVVPLLAAIAFGFVLYGGVLYIISRGDPEKVAKAKNTLLWAIVAVIIIALSYLIVVTFTGVLENNIL